jgi:hemolysin activation/secretion protein
MVELLAQLLAPPVQRGPVRLPGPGSVEQRPSAPQGIPPDGLTPEGVSPVPPASPGSGGPATPAGPAATVPLEQLPAIRGLTLYSPTLLQRLLAACSAIADPAERLRACAATLGTRLVSDGYVSSRVYVQPSPAPGFLEVVEGRLVAVEVNGSDARLNRRVERLLRPLRGGILNVPVMERQLRLLQRQPGIGQVRGTLARLGSDPSQGIFRVSIEPRRQAWQGEFALRNDGTNGTGEARATATLLKPSLAVRGDTLLLYGELNASDAPELGTVITSLSYTLPLGDAFSLTGAFGYSRRNLVELPSPADGFSTSQYQALGQLEWVFSETLSQRWSLFAGYSGSRSNTYLQDRALPDVVPESVRNPSNGYLRLGVAASGVTNSLGWGGNAYLLQGIAAATSATQRQELAAVGIEPGEATAIGGIVNASWGFAPRWQLNLSAGGQVAFRPLTSSMQFTLGSDVGLRGLPGQLISGDDGWLGTGELVWTFWQSKNQALQLVPFIGAGGIRTSLPGITFSDTVGAGGILARWLAGDNWTLELGWVDQFSSQDNPGVWTDWALGQGLYAKVQYRF